jgi:hypothetical protein
MLKEFFPSRSRVRSSFVHRRLIGFLCARQLTFQMGPSRTTCHARPADEPLVGADFPKIGE